MKNLRTKLCAAMGALVLLGSGNSGCKAMDPSYYVVNMIRACRFAGLNKLACAAGLTFCGYGMDMALNEGRITECVKNLSKNTMEKVRKVLHIEKNDQDVTQEKTDGDVDINASENNE